MSATQSQLPELPESTNAERLFDNFENGAIPLNKDDMTKALLVATGIPFDQLDQRIASAKKDFNVVTATGGALDNIGYMANVKRKTDEPDDRYRIRIIATIRASLSGCTFDEVANFAAYILDCDTTELNLYPQSDEPVVLMEVDQNYVRQSPFEPLEIADLMNQVIPLDANFIVDLQGTFIFKNIGETDDPSKGFSDSQVDGGTLSGDIERSLTQ